MIWMDLQVINVASPEKKWRFRTGKNIKTSADGWPGHAHFHVFFLQDGNAI